MLSFDPISPERRPLYVQRIQNLDVILIGRATSSVLVHKALWRHALVVSGHRNEDIGRE